MVKRETREARHDRNNQRDFKKIKIKKVGKKGEKYRRSRKGLKKGTIGLKIAALIHRKQKLITPLKWHHIRLSLIHI